jgi:predicted acylesterase/phospholipase RssA/CRP-like cAMP-binding protein
MASESLADIPFFAALAEDERRSVASRASPVRIRAGDWLFREGDDGRTLYVVTLGRLEVVGGEPPGQLRVLGPGATLGELALLTDSPRSASVRALRDSELVEIDGETLDWMLASGPKVGRSITRELATTIQQSRAIVAPSSPRPGTIAIIGLERDARPERFAEALHAALARRHSVGVLSPGADLPSQEGWPAALDHEERVCEQVLLVGDDSAGGSEWARFCVRQADRVLVLARGAVPERIDDPEISGCDLIFEAGGDRRDLVAWAASLDARNVHCLDAGRAGTVERLAASLAGDSVGIVLSGGGARGFAHVGVLEALIDAGIQPARVGGTSIGAFVGALYASGATPDEIYATMVEEFVDRNPLGDYTVPLVALVRGGRGRALVERVFGSDRIEVLERDYFCVSCDLITACRVVHRRGLLSLAVGASMALPGIVPPVPHGDRLLVDGGTLDNLPVEEMRGRGEGPVIAVDITGGVAPSGMARRPATIARRARGALLGRGAESPLSAAEILSRAITLGSGEAVETARRSAHAVIAPEVASVRMLDWRAGRRLREAGRESVERALESDMPLRGLVA